MTKSLQKYHIVDDFQHSAGEHRSCQPAGGEQGAARNVTEDGSLTNIATALVDTGSEMDEAQAIEFMLDKLKAIKTSEEFFSFMKR